MRYVPLARRAMTLIGGVLVLRGLFGPWISLEFYRAYEFVRPLSPEVSRLSMKTYAKMSPFTFTYILKHLQSGVVTRQGTYHLYDPLASLIGVACIVGIILGALGPNIGRWKLTVIGGVLVLSSAVSFVFCLPNNLPKSEYTIMLNWNLTLLGGIFILSAPALRFLDLTIQKIHARRQLYKKWPRAHTPSVRVRTCRGLHGNGA